MNSNSDISLRDWFAIHSPEPPTQWIVEQKELDRQRDPNVGTTRRTNLQLLAQWKWAYADAMLNYRDRK